MKELIMRRLFVITFFAVGLLMVGCSENEKNQTSQEQPAYGNIYNQNDIAGIGNLVMLRTTMGNIVIEMQPQAAPYTVNNFLRYVTSGFYNGLIFHRVMSGFMIQGGGLNAQMQEKITNPPVRNEFNISNTRGTVAMAKLGGDPDSATSQFFINVADNSRNLDNQNGGFTVFGVVVEGMDIVDKIAKVRTTRRNQMSDVPVEPIIITSATVLSQDW